MYTSVKKTYNLLPAEKFESLFLAVTFSRCAYSVPEGCDPLAAGPAHQPPPAGQGAGGVPHRHQHPVRGAEGSRRQAPTDAVAAQLLGVIVAILKFFFGTKCKIPSRTTPLVPDRPIATQGNCPHCRPPTSSTSSGGRRRRRRFFGTLP